MELSKSETLLYSTLRIEMINDEGKLTGSATGFILSFPLPNDPSSYCPVLVTNRHVLEQCLKIRVVFTKADPDHNPIPGQKIPVLIDTNSKILHPNDQIDLGIIPLAPTIRKLNRSGNSPFFAYIMSEIIPTESDWKNFDAIESIIMVGYPNSLFDTVNNLPIIRHGMTASHPAFDFCGRPEFLADMSCFPGSSGSPVLIHSEGVPYYDKRTRNIVMKARTFLLGVQAATHLRQEPISDGTGSVRQYLDLGCIIKSSELSVFAQLLGLD